MKMIRTLCTDGKFEKPPLKVDLLIEAVTRHGLIMKVYGTVH